MAKIDMKTELILFPADGRIDWVWVNNGKLNGSSTAAKTVSLNLAHRENQDIEESSSIAWAKWKPWLLFYESFNSALEIATQSESQTNEHDGKARSSNSKEKTTSSH